MMKLAMHLTKSYHLFYNKASFRKQILKGLADKTRSIGK